MRVQINDIGVEVWVLALVGETVVVSKPMRRSTLSFLCHRKSSFSRIPKLWRMYVSLSSTGFDTRLGRRVFNDIDHECSAEPSTQSVLTPTTSVWEGRLTIWPVPLYCDAHSSKFLHLPLLIH